MISLKTLYIEDGLSHLIEIECDKAPGIPGIVFSGRAGKIVEESAIRVRQAIRNAFDISFTAKILINLIPSDIKKNTNLFDLPLSIAILGAINKSRFSLHDTLILGELSLGGETKVNHSVIPHILRAQSYGFKRCIIADEKIPDNLNIPINIIKVRNLKECWNLVLKSIQNSKYQSYKYESKEKVKESKLFYISRAKFEDNIVEKNINITNFDYDFKNYIGGILIKRALTICAAGFHSIYLLGPSGTGKTLLSTMFKEILPPLYKNEQYELLDLYSQYNIPFDINLSERPYRSPHHSSTIISIVGGGNPLSIGEVSLAHNGVLVLDEINLFNKKVLESLREPFEEQKVMISRAKAKVIIPSSFILFLISNLCNCGNYGSTKRVCVCTNEQRQNFQGHISNALKDRIDITYTLDDESIKNTENLGSSQMKLLVIKAMEKQFFRFLNSETKFNGKIYKTELKKYIKLDDELENYLLDNMKKTGQSFRKMEKIVKVARTIADIEDHTNITKTDLQESIFYVTGLKN